MTKIWFPSLTSPSSISLLPLLPLPLMWHISPTNWTEIDEPVSRVSKWVGHDATPGRRQPEQHWMLMAAESGSPFSTNALRRRSLLMVMAMMGTTDVVYAWVMCLCLRIKLLSFCSRLCNTHFQHSLAKPEFGNEASPRRRTGDFTHVFVQLQPTVNSSCWDSRFHFTTIKHEPRWLRDAVIFRIVLSKEDDPTALSAKPLESTMLSMGPLWIQQTATLGK